MSAPSDDPPSLSSSVFLGTGSVAEKVADLRMRSNGPVWAHTRTYDSLLDSTDSGNDTEQGWLWRHSLMPTLASDDEGDYENADVTIILDAYTTLNFTNTAEDTWQEADYKRVTLTHDTANDALVVETDRGAQWRFRDFDYATTDERGKLYEVRDTYANAYTLTYSSGVLTRVDDDDDHRATYAYVSGGANDGKLQTIKLYKAQSETNANLIGQVDYTYAASDGDADHGWKTGDLILVTVQGRATSDADGTLSMARKTHYRYWKGTYHATNNPGTDHKLKYILRPENFERFDATYDYDTATDAQVADYANVYFEYDSNYRVSEVQERGASCGGCGSGTSVGTTTLDWTTNGTTPSDYDTWNLHAVADREDDTRIIFDVNKTYGILTWVFQDEDDGSPTQEWIWHYDYTTHNRLERAYHPSALTDYSESSPYAVTTASTNGFVQEYEYFGSGDGDKEDYLKAVKVKQGSSGSAIKVVEYDRTSSGRPDLITSATRYESASGGGSSGQTTTYAYTFYDVGTNGIKQITITHPSVSTAKNGPGASAEEKQFYDKHGHLRWTRDGEGYVNYHGYDDGTNGTGRQDLTVADVNTGTLPAVIDTDWDGTDYGLGGDDDVPFSRTGTGTALNIDSSRVIDFLGRVRKTTDAEGMITWSVYKADETRVYPAWNDTTDKCESPARITKYDKEGRAEEIITLKTSTTIGTSSNDPDGSETPSQSDYATWAKHTYNSGGQLTDSKQYHAVPSSGDGTRYSNYYQTSHQYDSMGRREYVVADVANESPQDREQVTQTVYDVMGRVIETKSGVSDNNHDAVTSNGIPTMVTSAKYYYDDPDAANGDSDTEHGVGDGNLSWVVRYYGTGASDHNDTRFGHDWRNRRTTTLPPVAPYTLAAYDNLGRVTASGTFSSATGLDPGDDPGDSGLASNRLSLGKSHYDEMGRVYKTERFMDPGDATPGDALTSNTYHDRRSWVWAVDAPNTGVRFTKHDGPGRRAQTLSGTQFDDNKYVPSGGSQYAPDYPDDDEGIVEVVDYTLDEVGNVTKTVRKELNHNDTNGMDLDGTDFVRTYVYSWHDSAHRLTDTANYGTNNASGWKDNSTAPTYGASPPARSDTVLVTTYTYNADGRRETVTGPDSVVAKTEYDALARTVARTEDFGTNGADLNRKTEYQYNGQGSLVRIMHDPGADNTFANGKWTMAGTDVDQVTEYAYTDSTSARRVKEIRYPTGDGTVGSSASDKIVFAYHADGTVNTRTDQNGSVLTYEYDTLRRKTAEKITTLGSGVDGTVRAATWTYDSAGRVEYVTTHSDATPDTTTWADAVNQVKNHYDTGGYLTKQEQEEAGKVDGSTRAVEFGYGTDFTASGNYKRLKYVEHPDNRKIWRGYTHTDTANTFEDTINDKFSRVGQIAFDEKGGVGDLLAEYDFNGLGRPVRRNHTEGSGWAGNDTRTDLWQGTSGEYKGLDRFGRTVDLKMVDYSGTATDFGRRKYTYDRSSNPTVIENAVYESRSMDLTYDDLDRLTQADEGILVSGSVAVSNLARKYDMDLLGNLTPTAGGFKQNSSSATFTHAVNATNEITTLNHPNPAGQPRVVYDEFTSSLSSLWSETAGEWSISSEKVKVDDLPGSGPALLEGGAVLDDGSLEAKITLAAEEDRAGVFFSMTDGETYYGVELVEPSSVDLVSYTSSGSSTLATASVTIAPETEYLLRVRRIQRHVEFELWNAAGTSLLGSNEYDASTDFADGTFGLYAFDANVTFDDFGFTRIDQINPAAPRWVSSAKAVLNPPAGELLPVETNLWGGVTCLSGFGDDDYIAQADIDLNSGDWAELIVRYVDPDNHYAVRIGKDTGGRSGPIELIQTVRGKKSTLADDTYSTASSVTVKVKVSGTTLTAWVDGTQEINTNASVLGAGGVGLASEKAKFDNVKVGYDNNSDDDIDDAGDDLIVNEGFSSTSTSPSHDDNGNLTNDGTYKYTYDAWNRLVKVTGQDTDVTIQQAWFDGLGRRVKKVVTKSGDLDGTTVYHYNGHQLIESRDGSGNVVTQVYHGTRYIDEVVSMRTEYGRVYLHQDANYNVTGLTDITGRVLERYYYSPYGTLEVVVDAHPFDYDDDGDVDSDDADAADTGGTCRGDYSGDCRRLDADCDRDVDGDDYTIINNFVTSLSGDMELQRVPAATRSQLGNAFTFQGKVLDPETGLNDSRRRTYSPRLKRLLQRDPLGLEARILHREKAGPRLLHQRLIPRRQYRDGSNLYAYVQGNPLAWRDPQGTYRVDLQNCSIIGGFPNAPDDPCTWDDQNGNPLTHDDFKNSPCFGGDWPGISDVEHCKKKGHGSTCRCYRQITWFGNDSHHVCFHDDDGDGTYDCFDGHQDDIGCCIGKGLFGECIWDLCACLWHIIVES